MASIRARAFRALIRASSRPGRATTLEERRERIEQLAARFRPPRGTVVTPLEGEGVSGEWVLAPGARSDRVILYIHGGAFCMGSPLSHRNLVGHICSWGAARALSLDYRLAPEHPYPAALDDACAAFRYLQSLGIPPARIAFAGDSAGANILLATVLRLRDAGEALPAAMVCISPPTDLTGGSESLVSRARMDPIISVDQVAPLCRAYAGKRDPRDPGLSPLWADLHGLPPLLIHVGTHEILHDDAVRFARKAEEAGVEVTLEVWDQLWHVFHAAVPYVPESTEAIRTIGRFLCQRIPDTPGSATRRRAVASGTSRGGALRARPRSTRRAS